MSKHNQKIPPPNVHPDMVNVGGGHSLFPRPGAGPHSSFNLEQVINAAPLDTSNAPEDQQASQQQQPPSDGTRPEHLSIAQGGEPQRAWEHGDEEKVQRLATSAGAQPSRSAEAGNSTSTAGEGSSSSGADPGMYFTNLRGLPGRVFSFFKDKMEKLSGTDDEQQPDEEQQQQSQQSSTVHPGSENEVYEAMDVLNKRLPPELVAPIIDFAEYYVHQVIGSRDEEKYVSNSNSAVYLRCRIPDFTAFDTDTEGKGGRKEEVKAPEGEHAGEGTTSSGARKVELGRQGRVRKLIFKIRSHDQGWTSNRGMGTYSGAFSWIDLELYRNKDAVLAEDAARAAETSMADKTTETEKSGGKEDAKGEEPAATPDIVENPEDDDDSEEESSGNNNNNSNSNNNPIEDDNMVKIDGPSLLQLNVHGKRETTEHVIVWDDITNELDDEDPEKWEEGNTEGAHKDGHLSSRGAFVRQLRGGDELRIIMKCQYPGWSCTVESCEVTVVWAV